MIVESSFICTACPNLSPALLLYSMPSVVRYATSRLYGGNRQAITLVACDPQIATTSAVVGYTHLNPPSVDSEGRSMKTNGDGLTCEFSLLRRLRRWAIPRM